VVLSGQRARTTLQAPRAALIRFRSSGRPLARANALHLQRHSASDSRLASSRARKVLFPPFGTSRRGRSFSSDMIVDGRGATGLLWLVSPPPMSATFRPMTKRDNSGRSLAANVLRRARAHAKQDGSTSWRFTIRSPALPTRRCSHERHDASAAVRGGTAQHPTRSPRSYLTLERFKANQRTLGPPCRDSVL